MLKYPDMQNRRELRGHSKEIEDITCHPNKNQVSGYNYVLYALSSMYVIFFLPSPIS